MLRSHVKLHSTFNRRRLNSASMRDLICLLCNERRSFDGFLSHIRQHISYYRYHCTKCDFLCDAQEQSALHQCETSHVLKFDEKSYQEELAVKIFGDCYKAATSKRSRKALCRGLRSDFFMRKKIQQSSLKVARKKLSSGIQAQSADQHSDCIEIIETDNNMSELVEIQNQSRNCSTQCEVSAKCDRSCTEVLEPSISMAKKSSRCKEVSAEDDKLNCVIIEKTDKNIYESNIDDEIILVTYEPLASRDSNMTHRLERYANSSIIAPENNVKNNISSIPICPSANHETSPSRSMTTKSSRCIFSVEKQANEINKEKATALIPSMLNHALEARKRFKTICQKCGKEVDADYLARRKHAWDLHFSRKDELEVLELLSATVKHCFPSFTVSSDSQCTECGKEVVNDSCRRRHVLKNHFIWTTVCFLAKCTTVVSDIDSLKFHIKMDHGKQSLLGAETTEIEIAIREADKERNFKFMSQMIMCFPCSVPRQPRCIVFSEILRGLPSSSLSSKLESIIDAHNSANSSRLRKRSCETSSSGSDSSDDEKCTKRSAESC